MWEFRDHGKLTSNPPSIFSPLWLLPVLPEPRVPHWAHPFSQAKLWLNPLQTAALGHHKNKHQQGIGLWEDGPRLVLINRETVGHGSPEQSTEWPCALGLVDSLSHKEDTVKGSLMWDPWKSGIAKLCSRPDRSLHEDWHLNTYSSCWHGGNTPGGAHAFNGNMMEEADDPVVLAPSVPLSILSSAQARGDSHTTFPCLWLRKSVLPSLTNCTFWFGLEKFSEFCLKFKAISLYAWERTGRV